MAAYTIGQRTTSVTIATAAAEVRASSTNKPSIMEFGFTQNTAPGAATAYGLGRAAVIGATPLTPANALDEQDGNAGSGLTTMAVAWTTTGPTVPANFFRRVSCSTLIGVGAIWAFPRGLRLTPASSVVLWLITAAVAVDAWAVIDE